MLLFALGKSRDSDFGQEALHNPGTPSADQLVLAGNEKAENSMGGFTHIEK